MDLLNLFVNSDEAISVQAGEPIFQEGEIGDVMYVLIEGTAEISVRGQVLETASPGEILGEMALIDVSPRSATATAISDCRLVSVDQHRFTFLVQETPYFAIHVMKVLADRLRKMNQVFVH